MARNTLILAVAVLVATTLASGTAEARGYGRYGGVANTPFGTINMNSPEWRASGGNMFMYQQLMEEKMMLQEQQMMMKQQQQYMQMMQKQAKQQKNQPKSQDTSPFNNVTSLTSTKKKKGRKPTKKPAMSSTEAKKPVPNDSKEKPAAVADSSKPKADAK
ncbi:hypothetical protein [Singulisphaera sp. PoT]|uniref:hypothetical protein n=1 Tax=Singulisphaera sp. PoT TaxID=3411797 RepID=UPI003BF48686